MNHIPIISGRITKNPITQIEIGPIIFRFLANFKIRRLNIFI
jgi:hypothetical protein